MTRFLARSLSTLCLCVLLGAARAESPVADAAQRGDVEAVRGLLEAGADVNAAQGDGMTALHWAAQNRSLRLVETLLGAGADVTMTTRVGDYTPLHLATRIGHVEVADALLKAGADANAVTSTGGARPIHFAAAAGKAVLVDLLLAAGADVDARESAWGQTPLMFAAAANRVDAIGALLRAGADVSVRSKILDVPVRLQADRVDRTRRTRILRGETGDVGVAPPRVLPVAADAEPGAAQASGPGRDATELGYDRPPEEPEPLSYADLVGGQGGLTALLHATREGHVEAARALLDGGADVNRVSAGDRTSPMLIATINGHFDLAVELLERGADPSLSSHAGTTPLYAALSAHWAPRSRYPQQHAYRQQEHSHLEVMKVLLDSGVDPNVRLTKHLWYMSYNFDLLRIDTRGATPFWRAAYSLDVEAMKLLVAYGADPTIPTEKVPARFRRRAVQPDLSGLPPVPVGGPAIHAIHAASGVGYGEGYAANSHRHVPDGWVGAVKYLVEELGADVNARDHNGYAPLHHAAARGDNELILFLVEHGADATVVSRRGQTVADMANGPYQRTQPYPATVALLEGLGSGNSHNCVSCQ